jgi:AAA ATPase domain
VGSVDLGSGLLLERASELAQLEQAVAVTANGAPRVVLPEGPAGIGKTALLQACRGRAEGAGFRVLAARGGELERQLGLGIVRQLFEPLLVRADAAERSELLERPAARVSQLFGLDGSEPVPSADEYGSQNALYWLCARLAERGPMMISLDDVHWSDATSLRWLAYLVRRLEDLSILLALARRIDEPGAHEDLLGRIAAESVVHTIRPGPLSLSAVHELARDRFKTGPQATFVRACHSAAGGNPLFTLQLLDAARAAGLRPVDIDATAVAELAPDRVSQLVLDRLRRLSPDTIRVAEQVALLGTHAEVRHVRALLALDERQVLLAGDELAAAGLLRPGQPLEFIHPVVRSSVYESFAAGRRAGDHGRAARLLGEDGAAPATVAMHLLKAEPAGDAWAAEILRAAATGEIRPETRATYLRRAIAEPAPASIRAEVLLELGRAESLTYDERALEHLKEALRLSEDPDARATAAGQLAYCFIDHDRPVEAEPVLREAIARLSGGEPRPGTPEREPLIALHVSLLQVDFHASSITAERLSEAIAMAGDGRSPAELDLLGFAAYAAPTAGATSAEVVALADRALRAADLSSVDCFRLIHCPVWALEFADRLDDADRWLLRILDTAQRWDGPGQFSLTASSRAQVSCRRGALADAEQDAMAVLELAEAHGGDFGVSVSAAALVMALTEQGRLAEADGVLTDVRAGHGAKCDVAVYVHSRGWLRVAQGRAAEAAEDFQEAGCLMREAGHDFPGFWPWRVGAATAQLALGRGAVAAGLAREQLEMVRPFAAAGPTGIALRTLGLPSTGQRRLTCSPPPAKNSTNPRRSWTAPRLISSSAPPCAGPASVPTRAGRC